MSTGFFFSVSGLAVVSCLQRNLTLFTCQTVQAPTVPQCPLLPLRKSATRRESWVRDISVQQAPISTSGSLWHPREVIVLLLIHAIIDTFLPQWSESLRDEEMFGIDEEIPRWPFAVIWFCKQVVGFDSRYKDLWFRTGGCLRWEWHSICRIWLLSKCLLSSVLFLKHRKNKQKSEANVDHQ